MKDLKFEAKDVKDKVVIINDAELSEEAMGSLSTIFKKAGAIEVIYAYGGITLNALSDEDLENVGLVRIAKNSVLESKSRGEGE